MYISTQVRLHTACDGAVLLGRISHTVLPLYIPGGERGYLKGIGSLDTACYRPFRRRRRRNSICDVAQTPQDGTERSHALPAARDDRAVRCPLLTTYCPALSSATSQRQGASLIPPATRTGRPALRSYNAASTPSVSPAGPATQYCLRAALVRQVPMTHHRRVPDHGDRPDSHLPGARPCRLPHSGEPSGTPAVSADTACHVRPQATRCAAGPYGRLCSP